MGAAPAHPGGGRPPQREGGDQSGRGDVRPGGGPRPDVRGGVLGAADAGGRPAGGHRGGASLPAGLSTYSASKASSMSSSSLRSPLQSAQERTPAVNAAMKIWTTTPADE